MIMRLTSNFKFLVALWIGLFIATAFSSGLELRNLFAAFFAWAGGIVTARITYEHRIRRMMKDMHRFAKEDYENGNIQRAL